MPSKLARWLGLILAAGAAPVTAATLIVEVDGVRSAKGVIRGGIYDAEGRRVAEASVPAKAGMVVLSFADLPEGAYAVKLFHDENGDGRLGTNFLGIPKEGVGFSNRAVGLFGPPSFDAMRVEVAGAISTEARLGY